MIIQRLIFSAICAIVAFPSLVSAQQSCHPSYRGACLPPNGPDVDCADGGGNGPLYIQGLIRVVERDTYRLDRDGDGIACEKK